MEQYHSIINNSVQPDAAAAPAPPDAVPWPAADEVEELDSDEDTTPAVDAGSVEASIAAVYARYINAKPDGTATKEGIRQVFERLDKEQTAKAERRSLRVKPKKTSNDVSEVYSPPESD